MKKVISFCLIACLLLTSLLCFAADDSVSCSFDGNELTVSAGAGAFESNTMVELVVVKPGKTLADISDAAAVVLTDSAKTGRLGSVSFKKSVSLNEEGKYKVYLIPSGSGPALNGEVRGAKGSGVEIVSAECSGGKTDVSAMVYGTDGKVIFAAYDSNDCLVYMEMRDAANKTESFKWNGEPSYVRVYLWNGTDSSGLKALDLPAERSFNH